MHWTGFPRGQQAGWQALWQALMGWLWEWAGGLAWRLWKAG